MWLLCGKVRTLQYSTLSFHNYKVIDYVIRKYIISNILNFDEIVLRCSMWKMKQDVASDAVPYNSFFSFPTITLTASGFAAHILLHNGWIADTLTQTRTDTDNKQSVRLLTRPLCTLPAWSRQITQQAKELLKKAFSWAGIPLQNQLNDIECQRRCIQFTYNFYSSSNDCRNKFSFFISNAALSYFLSATLVNIAHLLYIYYASQNYIWS